MLHIQRHAEDCKQFLEQYPYSIAEIYCDILEIDDYYKVFASVIGFELMKRVNFFPKVDYNLPI